ncbi:MAG TPA: PilZ domain-containing protein [Nannocystaceae bacterium]|nr:PilZ domain-containing protein [Nannocystaceae bacterium]
MGFADKRKHERVETALPIRIDRKGEIVDGTTVNASLGGVLVRVRFEPALQIGERVGVSLSIPTIGEPVRAEAEVRWVGLAGELGLMFATGLRAKETWALGQWLESVRKGQTPA